MKKLLFLTYVFINVFYSNAQTITDVDGNIYNTVLIGTQEWLGENLKVTKYNNGDNIGTTSDTTNLSNANLAKYQWGYGENDSMIAIYGRLYTWNAITDNRNVCPQGWHVPSNDEWSSLMNFLGGFSLAGYALKEVGTTHWTNINVATNKSGFTALPGGVRIPKSGPYSGVGNYGCWWSLTEDPVYSDNAWVICLMHEQSIVSQFTYSKNYGLSVRCIKGDNFSSFSLASKGQTILYPNPAINKLYFKIDNNSDVAILIYNLQGKLILSKKLNTNMIDISDLPDEVYLVKLVDKDQISINKVMKMKN